ncbi:metallophosphoesterase [Acuticoccus sp. I52.16.1]|uniref:metallophosphoesterase family protein n=1 Tax=Acuticoccus sp. I52.16.1 TaxID=2928472 RepID=UPI001FD3FA18|nr:metallophosphoesterase [Acuticoccus sp. I52.16.1]UOM33632.1 metallophosphoesterase [Acuticoccus sp. I52.16.1]
MRLRLAHLSDLHLGPFPKPALGELMSKRAFGYANWVRNRRAALGQTGLDRLIADMRAYNPNHYCVTGDLVNISTDAEVSLARAWLERLGPAQRVSVILGNHDAYVPGAACRAIQAYGPYIPGGQFPYARRLGAVALVGVSTAVATPPLIASGRVGAAQRRALAALLDRHDDAYKVVMIHHPPDAALASGRRGLTDVDAVREVLSAGCADLVLHGHTHKPSLTYLETPRGQAAVIGVPSASSDGTAHPPGAWAMIDIDTDARTVHLTRRGCPAGSETVRTIETVEIAGRALV